MRGIRIADADCDADRGVGIAMPSAKICALRNVFDSNADCDETETRVFF